MEYAYINGKYIPANQATISIFDRGLVLGDGLFETLKVISGFPEFFDQHYERLFRSAKRLKIPMLISQAEMLKVIWTLCEKSHAVGVGQEAVIRITLTRGVYYGGLSLDKEVLPTLILTVRLIEKEKIIYKTGVKVIVSDVIKSAASGLDPSVKTTNYLANIFAKVEADRKGAYEAILLGKDRDVAELSTANFFGVFQGEIYTPPLEVGILPGITRQQILLLRKELQYPVVEKIIKVEDLSTLEEAFLTSSIRGVVPIVKIDEVTVGDGKVGRITQNCIELYAKKAKKSRKISSKTLGEEEK